ncbi:hypothetical protein ACFL0Q_08225 [Thermodesulfobacteriota bacterium]
MSVRVPSMRRLSWGHYGMRGSAVSQANRRSKQRIAVDKELEMIVAKIVEKQKER